MTSSDIVGHFGRNRVIAQADRAPSAAQLGYKPCQTGRHWGARFHKFHTVLKSVVTLHQVPSKTFMFINKAYLCLCLILPTARGFGDSLFF